MTRGLGFLGLHCRPMFIFLTYDIKNYYLSFVNSFIFDILHHITAFFNIIRCFFVVVHGELSQPMGKTEFFSTAKNRTNSIS